MLIVRQEDLIDENLRLRIIQEVEEELRGLDQELQLEPGEIDPSIPCGRWLRKSPLLFQSITLACCMAPWFSVASFLPQLRERYNVTPAEASVLQIMSLLGFMLFGTLSSLLQVADRFPPHLQCCIGAAVSGLFNLLFLLTPPWILLLVFRLIVGGAVSIVYPTAMKVSGSWKPTTARGFAMGVMIGAICVGTSLPQLLAGFSPDWKLNVVLASTFCFVGSLLSFFVFRPGPFPFPTARFQLSQVGRLLKTPAVLLVMFSYLGHNWELFAVWSWIGSFFRAMDEDEGSASAFASSFSSLRPGSFTSTSTGASLLAFGVIATGLFGAVSAGWLADRYGRVLTCIVAASLSWLCSLLIGPASLVAPGLAVAIGLLWGATVIADSAQYSALMSEVCDQSLVGTALTVQLALGFVSGVDA